MCSSVCCRHFAPTILRKLSSSTEKLDREKKRGKFPPAKRYSPFRIRTGSTGDVAQASRASKIHQAPGFPPFPSRLEKRGFSEDVPGFLTGRNTVARKTESYCKALDLLSRANAVELVSVSTAKLSLPRDASKPRTDDIGGCGSSSANRKSG